MRLAFLIAALAAALPIMTGATGTRAEVASLVIDAGTGAVYHAINPNTLHYPASVTKLMTAYLAFEAVEDGRVVWTEALPVSGHASAKTGTRLKLGKGATIPLKDALLAMVIRSANDAATVIGERLGGSETAFAKKMTAKARDLGMTRTTFKNASGLPAEGQVTTARDLAMLARALYRDFPQHVALFAETRLSYGRRVYPTYNGFLKKYRGAEGLKTGFTCGSGYNLVAAARRDGRRLIGVVLGDLSGAERDWRMGRLFDAVFKAGSDAQGLPRLAALTPDAKERRAGPADLRPRIDVCMGRGRSGATAKAAPEPDYSRWGLDLGTFDERDAARAFARKALASLRHRLGKAGMPVALTRVRGGKVEHTAAIVGLPEATAIAECRRLQGAQAWCLTLSPEVLEAILEDAGEHEG